MSIPLPAPPALTVFTGAGCFDIIALGAKVNTRDNEGFLGNSVFGFQFVLQDFVNFLYSEPVTRNFEWDLMSFKV